MYRALCRHLTITILLSPYHHPCPLEHPQLCMYIAKVQKFLKLQGKLISVLGLSEFLLNLLNSSSLSVLSAEKVTQQEQKNKKGHDNSQTL